MLLRQTIVPMATGFADFACIPVPFATRPADQPLDYFAVFIKAVGEVVAVVFDKLWAHSACASLQAWLGQGGLEGQLIGMGEPEPAPFGSTSASSSDTQFLVVYARFSSEGGAAQAAGLRWVRGGRGAHSVSKRAARGRDTAQGSKWMEALRSSGDDERDLQAEVDRSLISFEAAEGAAAAQTRSGFSLPDAGTVISITFTTINFTIVSWMSGIAVWAPRVPYFTAVAHFPALHGLTLADGFVTVSRTGQDKPFVSKHEARKRRRLSAGGQSGGLQTDGTFYKFQARESKRNHLAELRQKFEEDKLRVQRMKQSRKFKPF